MCFSSGNYQYHKDLAISPCCSNGIATINNHIVIGQLNPPLVAIHNWNGDAVQQVKLQAMSAKQEWLLGVGGIADMVLLVGGHYEQGHTNACSLQCCNVPL